MYWLAVFRSNCESPVRIPITVQVLERPRSEDFLVDFSPNYCIGDSIEINPRINPASQKFEEFSAFKWYFDPNGISPVPLGQPSPNSHGFFVSQGKLVNQNAELGEYVFYISAVSDSNCETFPSQFRKVNFKINPRPEDPIFNSNSLELCEEDLPKVSDLNLIFGKGLVWYDEKIGDSALPLDHLLENGREYKAKAINESACLSIGVDYVRITTIECKPKLFLHKKALNFNPIAGDTLSYSIRVENRGIRTAYDLQVTDSLPMGTVVESTFPSGEVGPGVVVWSLDSLSGGESVEYEVLLKVSGDVSGGTVLVNRSYLSGSEVPGGVLESESEEVEVLSESALTLSKELEGSGSGYVGEEFGYRIVLKNGGPSTSYGLTLRDTLPSFMEYVSSTGGGQYEGSSGVVSWSVDRLGSGDSLVYELKVRGVSESSGFTNRVVVLDSGLKIKNEAQARELRITKKESKFLFNKKFIQAEDFENGDTINYLIEIKNISDFEIDSIYVIDSLSNNFKFLRSNYPVKLDDKNVLRWDKINLQKGESLTISFDVKIQGILGEEGFPIRNTAYLINPIDPKIWVSSIDLWVGKVRRPKISINKELENKSFNVGEIAKYKVVISNSGDSLASNLVFRDFVPEQLEFLSLNESFEFKIENGYVDIYIPKIEIAESIELNLNFLIKEYHNNIINRGELIHTGFDTLYVESDPVVFKLIDLNIEKSVEAPVIKLFEEFNYRLRITNKLKDLATNVLVIDTLPKEVQFIKFLDHKGLASYDPFSNSITWRIPSLGLGETLDLLVEVNALEVADGIKNTAFVEGNEMDVDLNNNSSTVYHKQMRIKIPNVFTPNNDGYNDRFEIEGIEALAQNELIVVNRWGIIIYRSKDYQNDWNGGILNEGAYYYVLTWRDRTGNLEELKGYVTIIRN
ncbi:MAG: DUF11 domain-containing protein [Flavobacteriales bacterium]|nr:DUF11 domain-containing protein [Flavobacteriales bacterium]